MEAGQMKQRVFTGVVTKLQDHCGTVDQEVQFQMSVVKGRMPQLGEKVLVKAVMDPSGSVGWTAQRVQTLNGQPFKSPPPLLPSLAPNQKPGILGNKPQALLKSPKIPPLIPSMQQNSSKPGLLQTPLQSPWGPPFEGWPSTNRKRHSEGMGGWRGGRWEDNSSWTGDVVHHKRRRWKGSQDEGHLKKSNTSPAQFSLLFSRFSRNSSPCDSLEMRRRYPHLPLPDSFLQLQPSWAETFLPDQLLGLPGPCPFHISSSQPSDEALPSASPNAAYTAKVILLSMPSLEELYKHCCEQQDTQAGAVHPTNLIKLVLAEKGAELQLLGGPWCSQTDGPAKDSLSLVRTAVRCVKEQTALDLQDCSQWHKLAEVRYLCNREVHTTVFFLPDVWRILPQAEEWETQRACTDQAKEEALSLPEEPSLVLHPSPGLSLGSRNLSSLLETHTCQSRDAFEVSLMAELLCEMLQRDFGLQLYQCLLSLSTGENNENHRAEEEESKQAAKKPPASKESKWQRIYQRRDSEEASEEEMEEEDGEHTEQETNERENRAGGEEGKSHLVGEDTSGSISDNHEVRPPGWCPVLPRSVLLAWVFFDRLLVGSLREHDLHDILLSLDLHLTPGQAQDLVAKVSIGGQCQYRQLAARWEDADPQGSQNESFPLGNTALLSAVPFKQGTPSRRSNAGSSVDVVTHNGTVLNIPNLLQSLKKEESKRRHLELEVSSLNGRLVELESGSLVLSSLLEKQEELQTQLQRAEKCNLAYEKNLKENMGHMLDIIGKMQKLVDKTTSVTEVKRDREERGHM